MCCSNIYFCGVYCLHIVYCRPGGNVAELYAINLLSGQLADLHTNYLKIVVGDFNCKLEPLSASHEDFSSDEDHA